EYEDVYFYFDQFCTGVDFSTGEAQFRNERSGEYITVAAQPLIACDGASSAVRMEMQKVGRFNLSQSYLEHGYKELSIPAGSGGYFQIEKTALHIWPRHTFMLIALPNLDGSFTCTLFLPFNGKHSFAGLSSQNKVNRFFKEQFPDAFTLMPTLEEEFFGKPTGSLVTIKCFPWHLADKALLLGDAAHAIVPFYGQGMNCAFEDCTLLNSYIEKYGPEW
ncbi:MAG: kynurenine 3-monooxygenase, partial [Calditrichae bacterium]|nr:kynurenine 3-monooxygenase [Calditrichia bacterium]NIW80354.1 kynurenine 3-monooxygenase [Calditrichia bacterium]